ncbi:GAF domain-containing protein [Halobacterium sp. R2-5]|uniref:GAF domain-containing protein n=1 Tax=Halobacterium sp. R2-5 TaxID=2715751 RepID=UPI00141E93D8|nr:GAF domain-containing protein [Halobacterium sp. R2-5]NIC00136.1 GAF domain-containing protein [Halobacterium sp. R2-5]
MAHTLSTQACGGELSYFQRLWAELLAPGVDLGTKLERLFAAETREFDMETAYLSRIDRDAGTQHLEVVHGPFAETTSTTVPLSESFCQETISDPDGTLVISDAHEDGYADHPAHRKFGLESYVGTTVTDDDELYGTLCFADTEPRDPPLTDEEVTLVEMYGRWATYEVNQWNGPAARDTAALGELEALAPSRVDEMLNALAKQTRRFVLQYVRDATTEVSVDSLERLLDDDQVGPQLYHSHLPKLEATGYVDWDRDAGTVAPGPQFDEIEPFLHVLAENTE